VLINSRPRGGSKLTPYEEVEVIAGVLGKGVQRMNTIDIRAGGAPNSTKQRRQ
jgi:hypothetical protein